jgi:hypothetical protein
VTAFIEAASKKAARVALVNVEMEIFGISRTREGG